MIAHMQLADAISPISMILAPAHRLAAGMAPQDWTTYDVDDVAAGLQEFLICVEMFFAALAHAQARRPCAPGPCLAMLLSSMQGYQCEHFHIYAYICNN